MTLTCLCCKLLFSIPQLHHDHYKTDWHKFNLKRQLAELPHVSKEEYEKRLAAFKEIEAEKNRKVSVHCKSCNKRFSSQNAMENHLHSKKHLEVESNQLKLLQKNPKSDKTTPEKKASPMEVETAADEEEVWEDDGEDGDWESCDDESDTEDGKRVVIDTNDCLFCEHIADSTENNVSHMTAEHSFFVPDVEYLTDIDGLIATLAAKIHIDHICLWCNGKGRGFKSIKSVKQHMIDKGHCKMLHEGDALLDYMDFYDYEKITDEEEHEDIEELDELLSDADYELVLPSGSTIGHRSLARYYKQNLKPLSETSNQKVKKVLQYYRSIGYAATAEQMSVRKARDVSYVKRMKDRYNLKLSMKNNKLLQPHFRNQVAF